MKKFISLLIALMMLGTTAFADYADELATLWEKSADLSSCGGEMTLSASLNQPLEFLDTIPMTEDNSIDIKNLAEGILQSTMKAEYSYSVSEDMKKMDMSMNIEFDAPITLNDDFKLEAYTKIGMWMTYDVTDSENPICKVIFKTPFYNKYLVVDAANDPSYGAELAIELDGDKAKEIGKKALGALIKNADISKSGNEYTIKLDDAAAKEYIIDVFAASGEYVDVNSEVYNESYEMLEQMTTLLRDFFEKTTILGEDGLVIKITKNADGYINAEVQQMHIKLNVYDILKAYEKSTKGLERDKAFIDVTFKSEAKLAEHNKATVTIPELTEENSEVLNASYDIPYEVYKTATEEPIFENNSVYYPMEYIAEEAGRAVSISKDGDKTIIKYYNGEVAEIVGNSMTFGEETTEFEVAPVIEKDGKIYCIREMFDPIYVWLFGVEYNAETGRFQFDFTVEPEPEELIEESEDLEDEEYYDEYIPEELCCYVHSDQVPYVENGEIYVPIYDLLLSMADGEITYESADLSYKAEAENDYGITSAEVNIGDNFVMVDGEKVEFKNSAVEIDGIIRVPIEFTHKLGFETENIYAGYHYSTYIFTKDNPKYIEKQPGEAEDDDSIYSNWFYQLFD